MESAISLHQTSTAALGTLAVVAATITGALAMWATLPVASGSGGQAVVPAHHVQAVRRADMPGMKMPMR